MLRRLGLLALAAAVLLVTLISVLVADGRLPAWSDNALANDLNAESEEALDSDTAEDDGVTDAPTSAESWDNQLVDPLLGDAQWQWRKTHCDLNKSRPLHTPNAFYKGFRMPDFLIAGFQKAATSTLVEFMLDEFADFISIRRTEIGYFSSTNKYNLGPGLYSHGFLRTNDTNKVTPELLLGEKSTDYMFTASFPSRVNKHNPNVKIIVVMREPAARALSEFKMRAAHMRDRRSFASAIRSELNSLATRRLVSNTTLGFGHFRMLGNYLEHGMYYRQLANLYKDVNPCRVHVILTERLGNPELWTAEVNRLVWFLGFPPRARWSQVRANVREEALLRSNQSHPEWGLNNTDVAKTMHLLRAFFKPENEKLFAMLGKPVAEWS